MYEFVRECVGLLYQICTSENIKWAYKRSRATYRKEKGVVSRWLVSSWFHLQSNHYQRTQKVVRLYVLALKMALDAHWA